MTLSATDRMPPSLSIFFPAYNDAGTIASLALVAHLTARKIGTRTGVETASIRRFAASLPRAGACRR